jgi:hypothetical protein
MGKLINHAVNSPPTVRGGWRRRQSLRRAKMWHSIPYLPVTHSAQGYQTLQEFAGRQRATKNVLITRASAAR